MALQKTMRIAFSLLRLGVLTGSVLLLAALFRPVCMDGGDCNYFLLSLLVGIPFGIGRMVLILPPASYDIEEHRCFFAPKYKRTARPAVGSRLGGLGFVWGE